MNQIKNLIEDKCMEDLDKKDRNIQLRKIIKEEFQVQNLRHIAFIIEYINNGAHVADAYKSVYGDHVKNNSASVNGCQILSRIDLSRLLDISGHGFDKIFDAMDKLYEKDPASYMKYQAKLRGLEKKEIKLSGRVEVPIINIVTNKDE